MPFGFHPVFLVSLLVPLAAFVIGAFALGYFFRKGWDAAAPKPRDQGPSKPT